jgi:hypothetical protein
MNTKIDYSDLKIILDKEKMKIMEIHFQEKNLRFHWVPKSPLLLVMSQKKQSRPNCFTRNSNNNQARVVAILMISLIFLNNTVISFILLINVRKFIWKKWKTLRVNGKPLFTKLISWCLEETTKLSYKRKKKSEVLFL